MQDGLGLFPNNSTIRYNEARELAAEGRIEEARKALEITLAIDPSYVMAHYAMALILEKLGDAQGAETVAREGLTLDPSDKDLQAFMRRHTP